MLCETGTKSFLILLASTASLLSVRGEIPSYIKVCKLNNPGITKCIMNSILELKGPLAKGIPVLGVPSLDPLNFDELKLELGPGFNTVIKDLDVTGLSKLEIDDMFVDISANIYSFNISIPQLIVHGKYDIDAALGGIPLKGNGDIYFAPKLVSGQGTIYGKQVARGGKTYFFLPKMKLKLQIKDYEIRLDDLFGADSTIGEVTNKLLNEEKTEVLSNLIPGIEKAMTTKILLIGNNICKHFTWDELFPES